MGGRCFRTPQGVLQLDGHHRVGIAVAGEALRDLGVELPGRDCVFERVQAAWRWRRFGRRGRRLRDRGRRQAESRGQNQQRQRVSVASGLQLKGVEFAFFCLHSLTLLSGCGLRAPSAP